MGVERPDHFTPTLTDRDLDDCLDLFRNPDLVPPEKIACEVDILHPAVAGGNVGSFVIIENRQILGKDLGGLP